MSLLRALVAALAAMPFAALAAPGPQCTEPHALDKYQLLRRLSLDLRGRIPSIEEYDALDAQTDVPAQTVRHYLEGEPFRAMMRGYHERLFWPNITNVQLHSVNAQLGMRDEPAWSITSAGRRNFLRGGTDVTTALGKQCGDYEQTHFLPGGHFQPDPAFVRTETVGATTVTQEGFRMVEPYWAPGTQLKVCAYDAQETPSFVLGARTVGCNEVSASTRRECGCGPGLRFCFGPTTEVLRPILTAAREQLGRAVDQVTVGGRPYTDLLLSTKAEVNGPLASWRKYLASNLSYSRIYAVADPAEQLADKAFGDASWTAVDRGPHHAGVLTLPAYLLRFQTNRARANRFRIDFECEHFVPAATLTREAGCSDQGTDLTRRCSCQYCHQTLEPKAAAWGNFAEAGTTLLTGNPLFPRVNPSCVGSSSPLCSRFYVTAADGDQPGSLLAYQYADAAHPEIRDALAAGPRALAEKIIADGTFDRCAVKRAFGHFVKREMRTAGSQSEEAALMKALAEGFKANGRSFPWLVEQVVSLPQYRSTR